MTSVLWIDVKGQFLHKLYLFFERFLSFLLITFPVLQVKQNVLGNGISFKSWYFQKLLYFFFEHFSFTKPVSEYLKSYQFHWNVPAGGLLYFAADFPSEIYFWFSWNEILEQFE